MHPPCCTCMVAMLRDFGATHSPVPTPHQYRRIRTTRWVVSVVGEGIGVWKAAYGTMRDCDEGTTTRRRTAPGRLGHTLPGASSITPSSSVRPPKRITYIVHIIASRRDPRLCDFAGCTGHMAIVNSA